MENPFVSLCEHSKVHWRHGHARYVKCRKSEFAAFWSQVEREWAEQEKLQSLYDNNPAAPWTDPISGEVDYEEMQEDLGVSFGDDGEEEYAF